MLSACGVALAASALVVVAPAAAAAVADVAAVPLAAVAAAVAHLTMQCNAAIYMQRSYS